MREYNGNDFIKWLVTFNDFIILNVTMLAFMLVSPEHSPAFIHTDPKLFFFFGNSAMVVASFSTLPLSTSGILPFTKCCCVSANSSSLRPFLPPSSSIS